MLRKKRRERYRPLPVSLSAANVGKMEITKKLFTDLDHWQGLSFWLNCVQFLTMPETEDLSSFFRENKRLIQEYVEVRTELAKLQGIRILSRSFSMLMVGFIVILMSLFILFFLGLAFAWWIAAISGSQVIGFTSAAGVFLLLLVLAILFRRPLFQNPLIRLFIQESVDDPIESD